MTSAQPQRGGLLTLVFTDIVGSTQLKQALGDSRGVQLIQEHHASVRQLVNEFPDAEIIDTAGDSFFLRFERPSEAVLFALRLQAQLRASGRGSEHRVRDRIGIHIGEVIIEHEQGTAKRLMGTQVDACARIMSLAQADQILLSRPAFDNARQALRGKEASAELVWLTHGPYRLKGLEEPVEVCEVRERAVAPLKSPNHPDGPREQASKEGLVRKWWKAAVIGAAILGLLAWAIWFERHARAPVHAEIPGTSLVTNSLAVLPFLTDAAEDEFITDGLTDDLITELGHAPGLRVLGRTSAFKFKGNGAEARKAAEKLQVRSLVEGSIRRLSLDQFRINARLINAQDELSLWSYSVDCPKARFPSLGRELAEGIAGALKLTNAWSESGLHAPAQSEAQLATWKGRFFWNKRGEGNLRKAIELFDQARAADPAYAPAWSGLGDSFLQLGYGSFLEPGDAFPKARAAAEQAIGLGPRLAEPHATLGYYYLYYEWKWDRAEQEFKKALELNPNYATGHEWYSVFLTAMNRKDEARRQIETALALDPLSVPIASNMGFVLHYAQDQAAAVAQLKKALELDPSFPLAHLFLGRALQVEGKLDEALKEYQATGALTNWVPTIAGIGYVYGREGKAKEAREVLRSLEAMRNSRYVTRYATALIYCALGERENTFRELELAVQERTHWLVWLNQDRRWDPVRSDPEFEKIVRAVGLPR